MFLGSGKEGVQGKTQSSLGLPPRFHPCGSRGVGGTNLPGFATRGPS